MNEPVLRRRHLTSGEALIGRNVPVTIIAKGGLHYLRGNSAPYFSLTADVHRKGFPDQNYMGGCCHELLLQHWPELADLAALHMSDIDGVPNHAAANGWYWLAGALGGMGEQYHGGNGPSAKTTDECLAAFANFCRIDLLQAQDVARIVKAEPTRERARSRWGVVCEGMRPRWTAEAEACIARHGLKVFGDPWPGLKAFQEAHPERKSEPVGDTEAPDGMAELIERHKLKVTFRPVPEREDREWPHGSRHFAYILTGHGRCKPLKGVYSVGPGIVEAWVKEHGKPACIPGEGTVSRHYTNKGNMIWREYVAHEAERYRPELKDLLSALVSDARGVINAPFLEDWASEMGLSSDSIKAKAIFDACNDTLHRLCALIGAEDLAALAE